MDTEASGLWFLDLLSRDLLHAYDAGHSHLHPRPPAVGSECKVKTAEVASKEALLHLCSQQRVHQCEPGGGHDWCPHLLTDAMSGDDVEGRGQPDSNLVCALYGGLLLPPPQVSRNIKNTFVRACFSSGLVFCMWRWRCASQ